MITGRALDWMVVRVEMPISAKFLTRWGSRLSWSKVLTEKNLLRWYSDLSLLYTWNFWVVIEERKLPYYEVPDLTDFNLKPYVSNERLLYEPFNHEVQSKS